MVSDGDCDASSTFKNSAGATLVDGLNRRKVGFHQGRNPGEHVLVMSATEVGTGPVTFRSMFIEEMRTRRKQMGLLQREFAEKAHVSLSSVKKYEEGQKRPERKFAIWCDNFYGCPGTFERLYDGMVAESHPSWF